MKRTALFMVFLGFMLLATSCDKLTAPRVSSPVFTPSQGAYEQEQLVSISCATSGAEIRYTTDGSEPPTNSMIYSQPILVSNGSTLIKAKAFKAGSKDSKTVTASFNIGPLQSPYFSPSGGIYSNIQTVEMSGTPEDVSIRYTTDGSEPSSGSTLYSSPIEISTDTTLKAKAFKADFDESPTSTASYIFQTAIPIMNPAGGAYTTNQSVSITCETPNATIRYTTNGTDPNSDSMLYTVPIVISSNTTLKAKAFRTGWTESQIVTANFAILEMKIVQGGTFHNGSSNVTLSSFYIGNCEVTQTEYQTVMGTNPSSFSDYPSRPVESISWFEAIEFCNRRSINEGITPCYSYLTYGTNPTNWPVGWNTNDGNHVNVSCNWTAIGYRLPTEMEWEYATRGGNQTHNYTYSGSNDINAVAWYVSNSGGTPQTVGAKADNELGLFDMSGNVLEWCWDIYGSYPSGSQTNPHGAVSGSHRVLRGGGFNFDASGCTVTYRGGNYATGSYNFIGFRICRISP